MRAAGRGGDTGDIVATPCAAQFLQNAGSVRITACQNQLALFFYRLIHAVCM
jgi:hypothetical protein